MVPGPLPTAPLTTARNADSLAAVHAQPGPVVTATCPVPALHSTSRCGGATAYAQGTSAVARVLRAASPPSTTVATWYL